MEGGLPRPPLLLTMPIYSFTDGKKVVELRRTVQERNVPELIDGRVFVRERVPSDFLIVIPGVTHLNPDQEFNKKMRDAYKNLELRNNGIVRKSASGLSHGRVRDLWKDNKHEASTHTRVSLHK
jgi:hypothetical protein